MNPFTNQLLPSFLFTLQFIILLVGSIGNILFSEKTEHFKYTLLSKYGVNIWVSYNILLFTLFAICQIIAFHYAKLRLLWLILGVIFFLYTIIILISKSSLNFDIGNKTQWQGNLQKLKFQRRITGLLELILLVLWSYSWSDYIIALMKFNK